MDRSYLKISLLVLVLLIVPFVLRIVSPGLEVYPSIVLPSGAGKVRITEGLLTYMTTEIYAKTVRSGNLVRLDVAEFLRPIPVQYFHNVVECGFGLDSSYRKEIKSLLFQPIKIDLVKVNEAERAETKSWLRSRLREAGCRDSLLIVQRRALTYDVNSRELQNDNLFDEQIYFLY